MKTLVALFSLLILVSAAAIAAPKAPSSKKASSKTAQKLPTQLPAYKGKTKVSVTFEEKTAESPVVLVKEPIAKEIADSKRLREETRPTPAPEAKPVALPSKLPAKTATPAPQIEPARESEAVVVTDEVKQMEPFDVAPAQTVQPWIPLNNVADQFAPETATVAAEPTSAAPTDDFEDRSGRPITAPVTLVSSAVVAKPTTSGGRTIFFETGYLDSRFDKLESDLKNGASTMSIALGLPLNDLEIRGALDVAHGMDQAVTPQNTRLLAARGGVLTKLGHVGRMTLSGGGTVGVAGLDVRSYREVKANEFTIEQHAMGTVLVLAPELDSRVEIGSQVLLQVAVRYYLFSGQADLAKLSALSAHAGIGYDF